MEGFQAFLQNVGSMISNAFSSIGNFFGMGGGSGSGGGGGSVSNLAASATLAAGVAMTPAAAAAEPVVEPVAQPAQQTYFMPNSSSPTLPPGYPSSPTNMHNTNAVQNQVLNVVTGIANQTLGRMGTAGQILAPTVDANIRAIDMNARANQTIAAAGNMPGNGIGPAPDVRGAFNASAQTRQERLENARIAGTQAMIERGANQSMQRAGREVLNGIYTPKSNGGVVGDVLNKVFKR